jgi:hypothetical protein
VLADILLRIEPSDRGSASLIRMKVDFGGPENKAVDFSAGPQTGTEDRALDQLHAAA